MNIENIKKVRDAIASHRNNFNLSCFFSSVRQDSHEIHKYEGYGYTPTVNHFADYITGAEKHSCGTTACIAGFAVAIDRHNATYLSTNHITESARRMMGLSPRQADQLFFPESPFWKRMWENDLSDAVEYTQGTQRSFVSATPTSEQVIYILDRIIETKSLNSSIIAKKAEENINEDHQVQSDTTQASSDC